MSRNSNPKPKSQTTKTLRNTTFTKAIDTRPFINIYGVDTSKKWPTERIWNEATALKLIRENTKIPVPRVLDIGQNNDGTYLTVERVNGIELTSVKDLCRQAPTNSYLPAGHTQKQYTACQTIANQNAKRFITEFILPELRRLTSSQTGLNSTIIPSPWVTEYDRREAWTSKTSTWQSFVFYHGDLGPRISYATLPR
jgi:serine/threonine protein kinase